MIAVNKTFSEAKDWVMERMCKEQKVETMNLSTEQKGKYEKDLRDMAA